jgi:hypothetical protein
VAHELEIRADGTASFASAREHAWHRLGTVLPDRFSAAQAMQHARLGGWHVRKEPLQTVVVTEDGVDTIPVEGKFRDGAHQPAHRPPGSARGSG